MALSTARRDQLEALLRARKLDVTLTSARPLARDAESRVSTGWADLDRVAGGGAPRGELSEIVGPLSSGATTVMQAMVGGVTQRGEIAALVDAFDRFDPVSAGTFGVDGSRLLWVRGTALDAPVVRTRVVRSRASPDLLGRILQRALKAFGVILQAGGFSLVVLDVSDVPMPALRRLPFTTWLRVERLLEHSETAGVIVAREPVARSARGLTLRLAAQGRVEQRWSGRSDRARRFGGFAWTPQIVSARRPGT